MSVLLVAASPAAAQPVEMPVSLPRDVPPNLSATPAMREFVATVAAHSPAFRAQCQRLGATRALLIVLRQTVPPDDRAYRAKTKVSRHGHALIARIDLYRTDQVEDTIGHEFEHILEQVEGVNLRLLAVTGRHGVREDRSGVFETARAIEMGRRVAREVRHARSALRRASRTQLRALNSEL